MTFIDQTPAEAYDRIVQIARTKNDAEVGELADSINYLIRYSPTEEDKDLLQAMVRACRDELQNRNA